MTHRNAPRGAAGPSEHLQWLRLTVATLAATALALVVLGAAVPNQPWWPELSRPESALRQFVDVTSEANLWSWFNVLLLAGAALAHAVTGMLRRAAGRAAWPWFALAVILAALSLDDLASLHERLQGLGLRLGGGQGWLRAAWVLPASAVAAVVVAAGILVIRGSSQVSRRLLGGGLSLFLGAALALELVAFAVLDLIGSGPAYASVSYLEELLEAWGAILVIAAAAAEWSLCRDGQGLVVSLPAEQEPSRWRDQPG